MLVVALFIGLQRPTTVIIEIEILVQFYVH